MFMKMIVMNACALKKEEGAVEELQHLLELQLPDEINNNLDSSYDGGDCCGSNVNTQYCNICQCLGGGGGSGGATTDEACDQGWIGDGYCDDINNNLDCFYDGGDCCGLNVNTLYCNICQCLEGGGGGSGGSTTPSGTTTGGASGIGTSTKGE